MENQEVQTQPVKEKKPFFTVVADIAVNKVMPILMIAFVAIGILAFCYYGIAGIVNLFRGGFMALIKSWGKSITALAGNLFSAAVLAALYKFLGNK
ncbi:MAG: hypothetical protein IKX06_00320 [Clostridia bacterium]|nr:hypothetical protein [Clostridia bacterium]